MLVEVLCAPQTLGAVSMTDLSWLEVPARDDVAELRTFHRGDRMMAALRDIGVEVAGKRVVDLGAGYGSCAIAAAGAGAASVLAVDIHQDRLDVIAARAAEREVEVCVKRSNLLHPATLAADADVVFLVGVVEYAGLWDTDLPVSALQERVFTTAYESLREGGQLVFGSKSRLWPKYVVKDVHTGQPLVNVLPRQLADRLSLRMSGELYRHHIYSPAGWKKLMHKAGFGQVQCYSPFLSYQFPLKIVRRPTARHVREIRRSLRNPEERNVAWGRLGTARAGLMVASSTVGLPVAHSVLAVATKRDR